MIVSGLGIPCRYFLFVLVLVIVCFIYSWLGRLQILKSKHLPRVFIKYNCLWWQCALSNHPQPCVGWLYVQSQAIAVVIAHAGFLRSVLGCNHWKTPYILQETRKPGYFKNTPVSLLNMWLPTGQVYSWRFIIVLRWELIPLYISRHFYFQDYIIIGEFCGYKLC